MPLLLLEGWGSRTLIEVMGHDTVLIAVGVEVAARVRLSTYDVLAV